MKSPQSTFTIIEKIPNSPIIRKIQIFHIISVTKIFQSKITANRELLNMSESIGLENVNNCISNKNKKAAVILHA